MSINFFTFRLFFLIICTGMWAQNENSTLTVLEEGFIFEKAEFPQCHASTMEVLENGEIIAAWFGGEYERHPEVSIYTSIKSGLGWSSPRKVADGIVNDSLSYPTWNPVLFKTKSKKLFLFYKVGPSPSQWWGMYKVSHDNGNTWSQPVRLPDNILGPIRNKPLQIGNRIISPSSVESTDGKIWQSHVEISEDDGETWRKVPIDSISDFKTIQPAIIQYNGVLKAFFRSDQDVLMESLSKDLGESWTKLEKTSIANPNSGVDAVTLANGHHLLVYNPLKSGKDWHNGRNKLIVAISLNGEDWEPVLKLEDRSEGEYSYPAIIQDNNGDIHITYTYERERIKYVKLRLN
ncbi:sialidase family protein [Salinimicrobium sp. 3283s]|uniref:sialidase family protein n=1 Tax=Salinimicrobium sp. 3283s TaxID=3114359 RepID=UPI0031EA6258